MKLSHRIQIIEELLQNETEICMVASKTDHGIKWNGVTYPDEESLDEAVKTICGRKTEYRPLVIIAINSGKKDTQ